MRIVIDLQGAQTPGSRDRGIGRYSKSFSRSVIENATDHEVLIALNGNFPESIDALRREFHGLVPQENFHIWRPSGFISHLSPNSVDRRKAAQLYREAFLSRLNPDVVHVTSLFEGLSDDALISIGHLPARHLTSVTLYDLIPHIHRQIYLSNDQTSAWYDQRLGELRRADILLGISESSCREAVEYLGIDPQRVIAAGTAADQQFAVRRVSPGREKHLRSTYGLKRPFIMYTGGIDHRKNIEGLIQSFALLPARLQRAHQLAVVCNAHESDKARLFAIARSAGLDEGRFVLTGYVPEDDLIDLYNICHLFAFPSWHEGFGLPALEAMSCGAPTIASNCSSLPEVVGTDDALFDPFDTTSIAATIERAVADEPYRQALASHALAQSARFSWTEVGRRAVKEFERQFSRVQRSVATAGRPRLAFCSPLPPTQSGIADVSKEVIPHLTQHYRVDAVVHDDELPQVVDPGVRGHAERVIGHTEFLKDFTQYDRVIYNLGNSGFHLWMFDALKEVPGAVILHDFFLSAAVRHGEFLKGDMNGWAQKLFDDHGPTALFRYEQPGESEIVVRDYPCNISVLENALGVIVHSEHAKRLACDWFDRFDVERWRRARLPREKLPSDPKPKARDVLGIAGDAFVVSSFGILNPFKFNDALIRAFASSRLGQDKHSRLILVGGADNEFASQLFELSASLGVRNKLTITGWTSAEDFRRYLSAADVAVQLRQNSRGETSAAVLDCLSHGIPTIVNANGAMSEIPAETVVMLQDEFRQSDLVATLNKLYDDKDLRSAVGQEGQKFIETNHAPHIVAESYYEALEGIYTEPKAATLESLGSVQPLESDEAIQFARRFGDVFDGAKGGTIYLDVSILAVHDAKTGIQRVVRNILWHLIKDAGPICRVEAIRFDPQRGRFFRAASFCSRFFNASFDLASDPPVRFRPGDTYVALDLSHHYSIQARDLLAEERRRGVTICFVVYDLLPLHFPEHFPDGVSDLHRRWLDLVADSDRAICISRAVADELIVELGGRERQSDRPLEVAWFHLGADIGAFHQDADSDPTLDRILADHDRPTLLVVGTIEPRKGLEDVLEAFEELWRTDRDSRLVIAGRPGWKTERFIERLKSHAEWGNRLFWFEDASDRILQQLYAAAGCLIAASIGEGFGLPIVEAALHGKPVIARDIPVFREVARSSTIFFGGKRGPTLAEAIRKWIAAPEKYQQAQRTRVLNWQDSASQFMEAVSGRRPYKSLPTNVSGFSREGAKRKSRKETAS